MEIYTKVFLANWVVVIFILGLDRHFLDDVIEKAMPTLVGLWAVGSLITVPVWLIYKIVTA